MTIVIPSASDDKSHGSYKPVLPEEDRSARVGAMLYFLRQSDHWVSVFSPKLVSTCHRDSVQLTCSLFCLHGEKFYARYEGTMNQDCFESRRISFLDQNIVVLTMVSSI